MKHKVTVEIELDTSEYSKFNKNITNDAAGARKVAEGILSGEFDLPGNETITAVTEVK